MNTASLFALGGLVAIGCTVNNPPPQNAANTSSSPAPASTPAPAATPAPAPAAPAATPVATATPAPATGASSSGGQPAYQETPPPTDQAQVVKFNVADGKPKGLHNKAPEAFWLWHDDHGKKWHLRSTTHAVNHRFHGLIQPDGGQVSAVKPTRLEWGDRVRVSDKTINFDFSTQGGEDGFDFETTGQCVRFYLLIDGKSSPALINVGSGNAHPPHYHFKLCP